MKPTEILMNEHRVIEQGSLGHESNRPTGGDTDQNGIEQRVCMIRTKQDGTRLRNAIGISDLDIRVINSGQPAHQTPRQTAFFDSLLV